MSVKSWEEEFYPVDAYEVSKGDAAKHSLQKWIGLRKENLRKHGVQLEATAITSLENYCDNFQFSGGTCALCVHYYQPVTKYQHKCPDCPITKLLGKACDAGSESPWRLFSDEGEIESMIVVLEKVVSAEGECK